MQFLQSGKISLFFLSKTLATKKSRAIKTNSQAASGKVVAIIF